MEKKQRILELRKRLDRTLDLPDLSDDESIKSLVKNQLISSSGSLVEGDIEQLVMKRSKEVSNFLQMLRSASGNERNGKLHEASHIDWKVKQDTDQLRVMYCEGPHGSPFHNLLAEGCADGPIDVCVCVSWESFLYSKWWPQYNLPTFKIILSTCLQKVRVGEEISLMRMKVPWPISDREALLHYFAIEYLEEDLILVLIKTISDTEHIDVNIDGFSRDAIPEAKDTVRVDLVGGFVMQKVDHNRCYFRVIANMDIKLDFVPPSLINFISRQLIGNGHKLFQKAVNTVATSDEDYRKALQKPMYARIREGIVNTNKKRKIISVLNEEKTKDPSPIELEEETAAINMSDRDDRFVSEITEEDMEDKHGGSGSTYSITASQQEPIKKISDISPEVEHALGILDNCIAMLRRYDSDDNVRWSANKIESSSSEEKAKLNIYTGQVEHGLGSHEDEPQEASEAKSPARNSSYSGTKSSVVSEERPGVLGPHAFDTRTHSGFELMQNSGTMVKPSLVESLNKVCDEVSIKDNGFHCKDPYSGKRSGRKKWFCCFSQGLKKQF